VKCKARIFFPFIALHDLSLPPLIRAHNWPHMQVEELRQQVRMLQAITCNGVLEEDGDDEGTRTPGIIISF